MSEQICNSNDDTGRYVRLMIEIEDEGNAEFDLEHQIQPRDGGYCVRGVVIVATREEAEALLREAA